MAYDPATYKVNLDTPQPDGRKGESPRNAFTKYNALVDALKNAPPAPSSTTTNKIPQWSNTVGGLKDGLGLSTSSTLAGNSDSNVPSEKAVKAYVDSQPKPQDFGVGAPIIQNTIDMDDLFTNATLGTTFIYSNGGGDGAPTSTSGNITTTKAYATWGNQWYVTNSTKNIYIRGMSGGSIGAWKEILHTENTNLIVSSGSNANGDWVQFADGTQMCWNKFTDLASPGANNVLETSWTYPKAFISSSTNSVSTMTPTPSSYVGISTGGDRTTKLIIYTQRPTTGAHYFEATAIGFWK